MVRFQFFKAFLSAHIKSDRGASLLEYSLLVGLIAVVCIAAVASLGGTASSRFDSVQQSL